jgi:hypothetical protein
VERAVAADNIKRIVSDPKAAGLPTESRLYEPGTWQHVCSGSRMAVCYRWSSDEERHRAEAVLAAEAALPDGSELPWFPPSDEPIVIVDVRQFYAL